MEVSIRKTRWKGLVIIGVITRMINGIANNKPITNKNAPIGPIFILISFSKKVAQVPMIIPTIATKKLIILILVPVQEIQDTCK